MVLLKFFDIVSSLSFVALSNNAELYSAPGLVELAKLCSPISKSFDPYSAGKLIKYFKINSFTKEVKQILRYLTQGEKT
jgi:hypothetical protein